MHLRRGFWLGTPKIISVDISGVYEVICMKLCNLILLGVKSHLEGRKTLFIAPKQELWAKKSKISNFNISGVYEAICTTFCSLIPPIVSNPLKVETEEFLHCTSDLAMG